MSAAAVAIVNAAISRTGGNTITGTDFTDGSVEANLALANYEQIVVTELESDPWRFARKTDVCTLEPDAPIDTSWDFAWTLPVDVLTLRTLFRNGQVIDYEINESGEVLTHFDDDVYAVYTYRAAESLWPSDFTEGVTRLLEALYLRLDDRFSEADMREESARQILKRAANTHAKEEAPSDPRTFPLVAVRRTGYGNCRR